MPICLWQGWQLCLRACMQVEHCYRTNFPIFKLEGVALSFTQGIHASRCARTRDSAQLVCDQPPAPANTQSIVHTQPSSPASRTQATPSRTQHHTLTWLALCSLRRCLNNSSLPLPRPQQLLHNLLRCRKTWQHQHLRVHKTLLPVLGFKQRVHAGF